MLSPSSSIVPANNTGCVTQLIKVNNPSKVGSNPARTSYEYKYEAYQRVPKDPKQLSADRLQIAITPHNLWKLQTASQTLKKLVLAQLLMPRF